MKCNPIRERHMKVRCPTCKKAYNLGDSQAGKQLKCACGQRFKAPSKLAVAKAPGSAVASASSPGAQKQSTVKCDCGKRLRIPSSAFGRAVQCPCGMQLDIASAGHRQTAQPNDLFGDDNAGWLDDLPGVDDAAPGYTPTADSTDFYSSPSATHSPLAGNKQTALPAPKSTRPTTTWRLQKPNAPIRGTKVRPSTGASMAESWAGSE